MMDFSKLTHADGLALSVQDGPVSLDRFGQVSLIESSFG